MKRSIRCAFVVLAVVGGAALAAPPQSFEFDAKFEPAFHPASHLTLQSSGASTKLIIQVGDTSTSVPVDLLVAADFLHEVTSLHFSKSKREVGLDGCDVNLRLSVEGRDVFASHVWSPTKASAPTEDALLRALYKATERSQVPSREADYLEELYLYFDNIQPHWKVLGRNPFTVRFNDAFWVDDFPAFRAMVASLPRNREVVFDITKLEGSSLYGGEATERLCDEFLKATKNRAVKWRAGKGWSELLLTAGIPKDRMIPPTAKQTLQSPHGSPIPIPITRPQTTAGRPGQRPNQSMEPTASRRTIQLSMSSTPQPAATRALGGVAHLGLVRRLKTVAGSR